MPSTLAEQIFQNPALYVAATALIILGLWMTIWASVTIIVNLMEIHPVIPEQPHGFGFRRISPSGKHYEWWADRGWMNAAEFESYCGGILGMSRESIEAEFGQLDHPHLPIL